MKSAVIYWLRRDREGLGRCLQMSGRPRQCSESHAMSISLLFKSNLDAVWEILLLKGALTANS